MNKNILMILVSLCIFFVSHVEAEDIFKDDFEILSNKTWQELPTGATTENGILIEKGKGGITLISRKVFKYKDFEIRVKFNSLESHYYIGFVKAIPWNESACWAQISGNIMECRLGNKGTGDSIGSYELETKRWYTLRIIWSEDKVAFYVDGKLIGETNYLKIIPESSLNLAIATLTLEGEKEADIEVEWVKVSGGTSDKEKEENTGKVKTKEIVLGNKVFSQQVSLTKGAQWDKITNKAVNSDYLVKGEKSPIFALVINDEPIASSEMMVEDFEIKKDGDKNNFKIILSSQKPRIRTELSCQWDESEESIWSLKVTNQSDKEVKIKTIFPIIEHIQIGEKLEDNFYFYPFDGGWCGKVACSLISEYPGVLWMQVMNIFNPAAGGGIYLYSRDNTGSSKGLVLKKAPVSQEEKPIKQHHAWYGEAYPSEYDFNDETMISAIYYPGKKLLPGFSFSPPDAVIGIHKGDWKQGLKNYSDWVHTWYKRKTSIPQWFNDRFNFLSVHPAFYYSDTEKRYIASEKLMGSEDIFQWAFWWDFPPRKDFFPGMNSTPGDYEYNRERGGLSPFKDEIKRIQGKSTRFTVYINQRFNWYKTKIGQSHGKEWARMDSPGHYNMDFLGSGGAWDAGEGWNECIYAEGWQDYLIKVCERLVRDTGMDGVYLDEMPYLFPCYNPAHSHYQNGEVYSPELYVRLMTGVTEAMRKYNPDAILMGEHAGSDYYTQFFDGSWSQQYYSGFAGYPFAEEFYDVYNINFFRFYFPEFKLAEWGQSTPKAVKRCFFNGIGICWDWTSGQESYLRDLGQVFKENGDAFASLNPEPLVETKKEDVFVNKFPIDSKVIYTIYNKNKNRLIGEDMLEVDHRNNYHFVELLYDEEVKAKISGNKDIINMSIRTDDVVCLAQLPRVISAVRDSQEQNIKITINKEFEEPRLFVFIGQDDSHLLSNKGKELSIKGNEATINLQEMSRKENKIILKLLNGNKLIDETILLTKKLD
ncbi:MAG: hypothetical protein HY606_02630 [Planctomycetes bacterium]|nr:hypothetical protein [Planctomycetota bacterium]